MKKIKIYAIDNDGNFNYYIFDKKKEIHKILDKLFDKIFCIRWYLIEGRFGDMDVRELIKINIKKNKDFHQRLVNAKEKNSRIDIFYGDKRIFIIIHCSVELKDKFNKELFKIAIMPKPKKIRRKVK